MFNGWKPILSATCFLFLPEAALAAPQEIPATVSPAAVQTHPTKPLSDSELLAFIAEQKRQNANSMIMQLQSPKSFLVDELGLVAGQIDQIKEEHARLAVLTQKLADKFNEQRKTTTDSTKIDELKTEYREELSKTFDEFLVELQRDVFLPHQNKKFDIICRQSLVSQLRNATAGKATWERVVTEYFQLAPEDLNRLSKAVEKASQELAEIESEARQNAVRRAVRALPEKKRLLLEQWALGDIETTARLLKIAEN